MPNPPDPKAVLEAILTSRAPLTLGDLERRFCHGARDRRELREIVNTLHREGRIQRQGQSRYTAPSGRSGFILGRLEVSRRGHGFVRPDYSNWKGRKPFEGDLFIPPNHMADGLDGDLVRAEFLRADDRGAMGRVALVVERARTHIVGWYQFSKPYGRVTPRNLRIERTIRVLPPEPELNVKDLDWVRVEVTEFTDAPEPLRGRIVERLGTEDDRGIDVLLVLRDRGIEEEFPALVHEECKGLEMDLAGELKRRRDLRRLPTITIDPATAKDFDDALSFESLPNGHQRLYVHIADVAHFVRPGTSIDREARERSTSVYPVDRVVPMLPERLSNDLCSLRPNEDRFCVTAEIDFDEEGKPVDARFYDSVIHSDHRLAYEEAQAVFDESDPNLKGRLHDVLPLLRHLRHLARQLRKQRFARGALDLDIPELDVIFDAQGRVSDLKYHPRFEAHQLIEECMLAANEAVARELTRQKAPLLYRIHETADEERLANLEPVLKAFGVRVGLSKGAISPKALQAALRQAEKIDGGHIVRRLILRALKRAEYSPRNAGHFGLASPCYCHFTSPIRRYPDVIVHRQIKALAAGRELVYRVSDDGEELARLGDHTSSRERRAQDAEREATTIKSLEFMKRHEGAQFDGLIAGVQAYGLFVEINPYPIEGFVPIASILGDRYEIDDLGIKLVGRRSGRAWRLGQRVRIQVLKSEPFEQQLDLRLIVEDGEDEGGGWRERKRRGRSG